MDFDHGFEVRIYRYTFNLTMHPIETYTVHPAQNNINQVSNIN